MQITINANGKSIRVEISEEQLKELGLVEDKPKTGYERGKNGKLYYCVEEDDYVLRYAEENATSDDNYYGIGNYYSDKTIAENNARADRLLRRLRQWQGTHDLAISEKDWKNTLIEKYSIKYSYTCDEIFIDKSRLLRIPNNIYFSSEEKVREAIEQFKDELIWYFTEYQQRLDEVQDND